MSVAFGNSLSKTHLDADTDDPSQARAELEAMVDRINTKLANQTLLVIGDKTGNDLKVVSGTAGTDGNLVQWNADGDAVDSGVNSSLVGSWIPLAEYDATGATFVDITTGIDSTYDEHIFILSGIRAASDGVALNAVTSNDGGVSWDDSGGQYHYMQRRLASDGNNGQGQSTSAQYITLTPKVSNQGVDGVYIELRLHQASDSDKHTQMDWEGSASESSGREVKITGCAKRSASEIVNGIRFLLDGGSTDFQSAKGGMIRHYGIKKS